MKFIGMRHDNNEHSRGRKSSQFLQMERERRQMEERDSSFEQVENAEGKQGQPVSRSGSDRRPDAVREEHSSKNIQDASAASIASASTTTESQHESSGTASEKKQDNMSELTSSTILPATGSSRRVNSNINRSESVKEQSEKRKQRRNISDPSHNTTSGNVDLEHHHAALSNTDSGSSSNSSISCNGRLSESPSNSVDVVGQGAVHRTNQDSDSDMDAEAEPWQNLVPPEELRNLSVHEKKRQDVINELFHTESSHVRNLKVLYNIFYKKILESQTLKPDELNLLFPNIKEMLDIHTEINKEMRKRRKEDPIVKELGTMLLMVFDDERGEQFKKAAANFCERQQLALQFIKKRRERDSKFDAVLVECEKKRQCRRLPLQGIMPTEMQRLSKYPLLLERLIHSMESNKDKETDATWQEELTRLKRAHQLSKEMINFVNDAAKVAHNRHRLEEIQKHLDTSSFERSDQPIAQEFKTIDLTKYRLIIEGGMTLRRPNKALTPVHILLLEEALVILHREGDRFLLKFFQSGLATHNTPLSPIIKMNTLLVRTNAACKEALFLFNTSTNNSQMYDLIAEDEIKRELWFKHFSDATEPYNRREGKPLPSKKGSGAGSHQDQQTVSDDTDEDDSASEVAIDLPPQSAAERRAAEVGGSASEDQKDTEVSSVATRDGTSIPDDKRATLAEEESRESTASPEMVTGGCMQSSRVSTEDWPLIQPSQVSVAMPPVHTAESMLTPLEQIRRKDALVKQALEDKEGLVADMLSIPREDFHHIADMASMDTASSGDPSERVLACIFQGDQLLKAINQLLNINDTEVISNKGGIQPSCASQQIADEISASSVPLTLPTVVRDIATSLSSQLTTLLSEVKQMTDERDRLKKELHRVRERLHEEHNLHSPMGVEDSENLNSSTSCASEQCTLNDSIQVVNKSDCEEAQ